MQNSERRRVSPGDPFEGLAPELVETARKVGPAYPATALSDEFRGALRSRLVVEAARLQREPARPQRSGLLVPAAVGAAAVAGLAVLGWRTRAIPNLIARAQGSS